MYCLVRQQQAYAVLPVLELFMNGVDDFTRASILDLIDEGRELYNGLAEILPFKPIAWRRLAGVKFPADSTHRELAQVLGLASRFPNYKLSIGHWQFLFSRMRLFNVHLTGSPLLVAHWVEDLARINFRKAIQSEESLGDDLDRMAAFFAELTLLISVSHLTPETWNLKKGEAEYLVKSSRWLAEQIGLSMTVARSFKLTQFRYGDEHMSKVLGEIACWLPIGPKNWTCSDGTIVQITSIPEIKAEGSRQRHCLSSRHATSALMNNLTGVILAVDAVDGQKTAAILELHPEKLDSSAHAWSIRAFHGEENAVPNAAAHKALTAFIEMLDCELRDKVRTDYRSRLQMSTPQTSINQSVRYVQSILEWLAQSGREQFAPLYEKIQQQFSAGDLSTDGLNDGQPTSTCNERGNSFVGRQYVGQCFPPSCRRKNEPQAVANEPPKFQCLECRAILIGEQYQDWDNYCSNCGTVGSRKKISIHTS